MDCVEFCWRWYVVMVSPPTGEKSWSPPCRFCLPIHWDGVCTSGWDSFCRDKRDFSICWIWCFCQWSKFIVTFIHILIWLECLFRLNPKGGFPCFFFFAHSTICCWHMGRQSGFEWKMVYIHKKNPSLEDHPHILLLCVYISIEGGFRQPKEFIVQKTVSFPYRVLLRVSHHPIKLFKFTAFLSLAIV